MVAPIVKGEVVNAKQVQAELAGIQRAAKEALRTALNGVAFSLSGFRGERFAEGAFNPRSIRARGLGVARINAEWHRQMPDSVVKRFPGVLMQVEPERGIPYQQAQYRGPMSVEVNSGRGNSELGNRILFRQIDGETKTPYKKRLLKIRQRVVQRNPRTGRWKREFTRGAFLFPSDNPRFVAQRVEGGLRIVGLLRESAKVPPRFSLDALLAQLPNDIYRIWRREFRREAIFRLQRRSQDPSGTAFFPSVHGVGFFRRCQKFLGANEKISPRKKPAKSRLSAKTAVLRVRVSMLRTTLVIALELTLTLVLFIFQTVAQPLPTDPLATNPLEKSNRHYYMSPRCRATVAAQPRFATAGSTVRRTVKSLSLKRPKPLYARLQSVVATTAVLG